MPFENTFQRFLRLQNIDEWRSNQLRVLPDAIEPYERAVDICQQESQKVIGAADAAEENRSLPAEGRAERVQVAASQPGPPRAANGLKPILEARRFVAGRLQHLQSKFTELLDEIARPAADDGEPPRSEFVRLGADGEWGRSTDVTIVALSGALGA